MLRGGGGVTLLQETTVSALKGCVIFQTYISFYLGGAKKFLWPDAYVVFLVTIG